MQTFLPYPSYQDSMRCLDDKRLGNQVYRECVTLIRGKWPGHPVSRMWRGYEHQLALYALCGVHELANRGRYYPKWEKYFTEIKNAFSKKRIPNWLGDERLHSSHRANLLRKNPNWYGQFGWSEEPLEGYWWPVK